MILGLYMLLWGKEKDNENGVSKEPQSELDCEKQFSLGDVSAVKKAVKRPA